MYWETVDVVTKQHKLNEVFIVEKSVFLPGKSRQIFKYFHIFLNLVTKLCTVSASLLYDWFQTYAN
jgi:hypothetical protein